MSDNKTKPTNISINKFLSSIYKKRRTEAKVLIAMMQQISNTPPVMWGPSIIGFGTQHYKYDSGRKGDMARIGFSPRKASITIYFAEGFDRYGALLKKIGKYKASVSCLYINKLEDIDIEVLRKMVEQSYVLSAEPLRKSTTVDEYINSVPMAARNKFDELRKLVRSELPRASEVMSYGIVGYKIDDKRARVFISGWKDHVAIYPVPRDPALQVKLMPYIKGKGTLWFALDEPLPIVLIAKIIKALVA